MVTRLQLWTVVFAVAGAVFGSAWSVSLSILLSMIGACIPWCAYAAKRQALQLDTESRATPERQAWESMAERHTPLSNALTSWYAYCFAMFAVWIALLVALASAITWLHGLAG